MCEELMMVCLDMRMYLLKQSLVHRPRLMMSHFGHPIAAAVVAAPIRREWDVVLASPSVVSCSSWFMSFRVRYLLFWNVKRGPDLVGCTEMYSIRARTGQRVESLAARRIITP